MKLVTFGSHGSRCVHTWVPVPTGILTLVLLSWKSLTPKHLSLLHAVQGIRRPAITCRGLLKKWGLPASRWGLEFSWNYESSPDYRDQLPRRKWELQRVNSIASRPCWAFSPPHTQPFLGRAPKFLGILQVGAGSPISQAFLRTLPISMWLCPTNLGWCNPKETAEGLITTWSPVLDIEQLWLLDLPVRPAQSRTVPKVIIITPASWLAVAQELDYSSLRLKASHWHASFIGGQETCGQWLCLAGVPLLLDGSI